jgi:hypothetical protein
MTGLVVSAIVAIAIESFAQFHTATDHLLLRVPLTVASKYEFDGPRSRFIP